MNAPKESNGKLLVQLEGRRVEERKGTGVGPLVSTKEIKSLQQKNLNNIFILVCYPLNITNRKK